VNIIANNNREHITICVCVNAAGDALPSYFIFKGKRKTAQLTTNVKPEECSLTESGYMNHEVWVAWVAHFLRSIPHHSRRPWALLILDGFGCHVNDEHSLQILFDNHVFVMALPAHTSAAFQPLDVANFGPLKAYNRRKVAEKLHIQPGKFLTREEFPLHIATPLALALSKENIKAGFRRAGIWPLDPSLHLRISGNFKTFQTPGSPRKRKPGSKDLFSAMQKFNQKITEMQAEPGFNQSQKELMDRLHLDFPFSETESQECGPHQVNLFNSCKLLFSMI